MAQIAKINQQLGGSTTLDASSASLLDQRDQYIDQLSQLMDIRVVPGDGNQVNVYTGSGFQLVGGSSAASLAFTPQGTMTPEAQWDADPSKSDLSSVTLQYPDGSSIDLTAEHGIRSGAIAAYTELRDTTLVQAQAQVDSLAAAMSSALSDKTTAGTRRVGRARRAATMSIFRIFKPPATRVPSTSLIPDKATNKQVNKTIGVDFSGGMASVVSQLNTAMAGTGVQFSNPASPPASLGQYFARAG